MGYLSVGSLSIPFAWIAFFLAYVYIDVRHRKSEPSWPNAFEQLLWAYLIVWKASYIVFYFEAFMAAPLSILYFDGGWKGHALALGVAAVVFLRKKMVEGLSALFMIWLQFLAVYMGVVALLTEQYLFVLLAVVVVVSLEKKATVLAFALLFMLLIIEGNWMNPLLWVSVSFLIIFIMKEKQVKFVAPAVIAMLFGLLMIDVMEQTVREAKEVAPLELETTNGDTYSIRNEENSIIILNFFATWCPPCKAEMPHLQAFSDNLPDDVSLIGVNLTARDDGEQALQKFMEIYNVTYPILLDKDDVYGDGYGVLSMPTTIILKDGQEVQRIVGPISEERLRKIVR